MNYEMESEDEAKEVTYEEGTAAARTAQGAEPCARG
jgi:hypothetical protein